MEKDKDETELDYTTVYLSGFYDGAKKWKDKIKSKAAEYQQMLNKLNKAKDIDRIKAINERLIAFQEILLQE